MDGVMRFLFSVALFTFSLIAGGLVTYLLGTAVNSQFVIGGHGLPVTMGDRLNMTMFDISNMWLYLMIILISFLIAFSIARIMKRFLPKLSGVAYPIAGAAAITVALGLMYIMFQTVPISGARSALGFVAQVVAGGIGGWVFGYFAAKKDAAAARG